MVPVDLAEVVGVGVEVGTVPAGISVIDGFRISCLCLDKAPRTAPSTIAIIRQNSNTAAIQIVLRLKRGFPVFRGVEARDSLLSERRLFDRSTSSRCFANAFNVNIGVSLSVRL